MDDQQQAQIPVEIEPATQPLTPQQAFGSQPIAPTSIPRKSKKGLIAGIIIAVVLVVLGGGSALAYNLWYQNPDKVIADAIINATAAKSATMTGTIKVENDDVKATITLDGKQADEKTGSIDAKINIVADSKEVTINGVALIDNKGDIYFKVENLNSVADIYKDILGVYGSTADTYNDLIDTVVEKVDGTWIKISNDDLEDFGDTYKDAKVCFDETLAKFKDDKAATNEIIDLYKKNKFLVVEEKLGSKDGSLGYKIKGDADARDAFVNGLKDTKIYKALHDCDESFTLDSDDLNEVTETDSDSNITLELWVDRWSHQITKLSVYGTQEDTKIDIVVEPKFNQSVEVKTPESATSLKDLIADLQELFVDTTEEYSSSIYDTTSGSIGELNSAALLGR